MTPLGGDGLLAQLPLEVLARVLEALNALDTVTLARAALVCRTLSECAMPLVRKRMAEADAIVRRLALTAFKYRTHRATLGSSDGYQFAVSCRAGPNDQSRHATIDIEFVRAATDQEVAGAPAGPRPTVTHDLYSGSCKANNLLVNRNNVQVHIGPALFIHDIPSLNAKLNPSRTASRPPVKHPRTHFGHELMWQLVNGNGLELFVEPYQGGRPPNEDVALEEHRVQFAALVACYDPAIQLNVRPYDHLEEEARHLQWQEEWDARFRYA